MIFEKFSNLVGKHAPLSPSNHVWIRYDPEKLRTVYLNRKAAEMGTRLHAFAAEAINLGRKQINNRDTLNLYINDAIKYHMQTEVCLYYSDKCFGWADCISFDDNNQFLRIHDLKTGENPASMEQLQIYAALFCLMKNKDPMKIDIELRLYQSGQVIVDRPDGQLIIDIMNVIIEFSDLLYQIDNEVGG